jgi:hypothetical protein
MNEKLQRFVFETQTQFEGRLKIPRDLIQRSTTPGEFVDAAVLGGYKGKLFEMEYVDWLNEGHLPPGTVAERHPAQLRKAGMSSSKIRMVRLLTTCN